MTDVHPPMLPPLGGGGHPMTTRSSEAMGPLARRGDTDPQGQQLPPPPMAFTGSPQLGRLTRKRAAAMTLDDTNHHPRIESLSLKTPSGSVTPPPPTGDSMKDVICLCTPAPKIPRPRNAFILYRQGHQARVVETHPGLANPEISKIIGEQWRHEPESVKDHWRTLAEQEKENHRDRNPGYRYKPRRGGKGAAAGRPLSGGGVPDRCEKCGGCKFATTTPRTPSAGPRTPGGLSTPTFASGPASASYASHSPRSEHHPHSGHPLNQSTGPHGTNRRLYPNNYPPPPHPYHQQGHGLPDIEEDYEAMSPTHDPKRRRFDRAGHYYHPSMSSPSPSPYELSVQHQRQLQAQHMDARGPAANRANGPLPAPSSLGRHPGTPHTGVTMPPPPPRSSISMPYHGSPVPGAATPRGTIPPPQSAASTTGRYHDFENVRLPPLQTHLATSPTQTEASVNRENVAEERPRARHLLPNSFSRASSAGREWPAPPTAERQNTGLGIMTPGTATQQGTGGKGIPTSANTTGPSQAGPAGHPPARTLSVSAVPSAAATRDAHARSIEAMVMSIPYLWKIQALRKISPPLAPPRPGSPAVECRGVLVAVEGASARLVAMIGRVVERVLSRAGEPGGDMDVKIFGADAPQRNESLREAVIVEEDEEKEDDTGDKMQVASDDKQPETSAAATTGSGKPAGESKTSASANNDEDADGEADPDAKSLNSRIMAAGTRKPSTAGWLLNSTRRDSSPPVMAPYGPYLATIMEWHAKNEDIVRHITTLPAPVTDPSNNTEGEKAPTDPHQKQRIPVALVTGGYSLTISDRFASTVLIPDNFAPVDHWNWMAQLWRGIVSPDLVVYARSERRNGGIGGGRRSVSAGSGSGGEEVGPVGGAEMGVHFPQPGVMTVWLDENRGIDKKMERRLEFELVEWVRAKWVEEKYGQGMV